MLQIAVCINAISGVLQSCALFINAVSDVWQSDFDRSIEALRVCQISDCDWQFHFRHILRNMFPWNSLITDDNSTYYVKNFVLPCNENNYRRVRAGALRYSNPVLIDVSLQRCRDEDQGVSTHRKLDCLFDHLFRLNSKKKKLHVSFCGEYTGDWWIPPTPQRPIMRKAFPCDAFVMSYFR